MYLHIMFDDLEAAVEALSIPVDGEAIAAVLAIRDRLDARIAEAVGEFDAVSLWDSDGSTSLVAWLRDRGGCSRREAAHGSARAKALRSLPVTTAAWTAGEVSIGQVDAVARLGPGLFDRFAARGPGALEPPAGGDGRGGRRLLVSRRRGLTTTGLGSAVVAITIDELVVGDPPEAWVDAGFAVDPDGVCRIGGVAVRLDPEQGRGIRRWSLRGIDADTVVDGIPTAATDAGTGPGQPPAIHPNGVLRIDHLVVASSDGDRTAGALAALGLEARRTRDDDTSYGMPMRQTFFRLGEVILELIAPQEALDGSAPGARFYGLALDVEDLDALAGRYGPCLGRIKDAVQPGRRIATLRRRDLGLSAAIAFMTPGPGSV